MRGAIYSTFFLLTMLVFGLVGSWWAVLAAPVAVLIGFAFAGAGLAATTCMRSFLDFDYVNLAIVPLFLFSATFFPLSRYPDWLEAIIRVTPLYQGVVLERALVLGDVHWSPVPQRRLPRGDGRRRRTDRRPPPRPAAATLSRGCTPRRRRRPACAADPTIENA